MDALSIELATALAYLTSDYCHDIQPTAEEAEALRNVWTSVPDYSNN